MQDIYKKLDDIEKNDWVQFYHNGILVIGQVEYVYRSQTISEKMAATNIGAVRIEDIFEVRKHNAL